MNHWLKEVKERLAKATPGPWVFANDSYEPTNKLWARFLLGKDEAVVIAADDYHMEFERVDAEFIAHARTDLETAIAVIERYEAALVEMHANQCGLSIRMDRPCDQMWYQDMIEEALADASRLVVREGK